MKRFTHKKKVGGGGAVTAVFALGGGGIAFAYFTSGGSGTGTAGVGVSPDSAFIIQSDGPSTPMLPGNGPQSFTVQVSNTTDQSEYVGTVYMSVMTDPGSGGIITGDDTVVADCQASWFTVSPSVVVDQVVPANGTVSSDGSSTIEMPAADSTDQDPCQGVSVDLAFTTTDPV